jgi:prevent-host-death family protein
LDVVHVSSLELQQRTEELVAQVASTGEAVVVGDATHPLAALVSAEDYALLRRIEDASDRELIARIKAEGGEEVSWETLKAELGL